MRNPDLILLHAPSVYDFREKPILHGPVSDVVPSTQVFEMYPVGFMTMLEYLQRHGLSVRIINIALRMLNSKRFNAEKLIRSLKPKAFGLDLHWMVHAQGSLELAAIVKKHHPDIPVIFGGFSSSYYHEELIRYPQVDYILRGDSTEEPLRQLMAEISRGEQPDDVPNLTWQKDGQVRVNELSYTPQDLGDINFDYLSIMRSTVRHLDLLGHVPFKTWFRYPITAVLVCKGCVHNCKICGGSAFTSSRICGRSKPAYREPGQLARDIETISQHLKGPIIILGDMRQAGDEYARELFGALKDKGVRNHVAFECFSPPTREFLEPAAEALPNFNIQISPESHDESIRRWFGRDYGNKELEQGISDALELGCRRMDVFFMTGIPGQTPESVRDTVRYCGDLLERYGKKMHPYISPLAPFLDPGSQVFEDPDRYGYQLSCKTLEEHREALLAPSWKYTLNYESKWMTRDELVAVTYEAALELNRLKARHGILGRKEADKIEARIERESELMGEIDALMSVDNEQERDEQLAELMRQFQTRGPSTICRKDEMDWPVAFMRLNWLNAVRALLSRRA